MASRIPGKPVNEREKMHIWRIRKFLTQSRVVSLVVVLLTWLPSGNAGDLYQVGTSVVDITPDYPIRLNGFGNRREESTGISQRIHAKAIAIAPADDDQQETNSPLVLVAIDSLGIRQTMVDEVAGRLARSHGIPPENLAITFSHSHCTPKVNGASDNIFSEAIPEQHQRHIDRYTTELTDKITLAAQRAIDARVPAHLQWGIGTVRFAKNRRTAGGPVDHDLPMLVARDPNTNQPLAIYVSYACHCVTLSFNQVSGDWAGYASAMIERVAPGCVALVSIGAGSDQNPISGVTGDQVQVAEAQGIEIASEVQRLLAGPLQPIQGKPRAIKNTIPLPLNPLPSREELVAQTQQGRPTDRYNATTQLQRLDRGEPLLTQIDYRIQTWAFGDSFCMTFLAGEVCVDYAIRLKREIDRQRFWLNAYSNDFCCYIPSERLVSEGGYGGGAEVPYFALPATLQAGLEDKIVGEVRRQVPESFHVPAGTLGIAPLSPEASLRRMETLPDLEVVLAASEPQISDPVAIDFGGDGRLWVAEMNDYGRDVYESFKQTGRIRCLRDRDGDGFFEHAETFLDGLRFPTDVKVWRDGILVCDAPEILFARDLDADGKADEVKTLFTGFEVRNAQARVNSLRFGLDNRLHGASGLFGGLITSSLTGHKVDCRNRDFCIDPDTGQIEAISGRTQQGRCRNDWGDWFGCSNGSLLQTIASDDAYLKRNPLAVPQAFPTLTIEEDANRLYPPEHLVTFELSGPPGRATSACGLAIYRDVALGDDYLNDAFTCEPVHQSVHRIDFVKTDDGDSWLGKRGPEEATREFLSSTDRWFRPVQVRTGPDGSLWVVDMYRFVIEHSRWIPQATLNELDIDAGKGKGRLYRVIRRRESRTEQQADSDTTVMEHSQQPSVIPDLSRLSDGELVAQLDNTNGTFRDLVHQMLLWKGNRAVAESIRAIAKESENPAVRIQALSLLNGLDALTADDLLSVIDSPNPDLQRHGLRLAERFVNESPGLRKAMTQLASSHRQRVRRQAVLSLGAVEDAELGPLLAEKISRRESSPIVRSAAMNSVSASNISHVIAEYSALPKSDQSPGTWEQLIVMLIQLGEFPDVERTLLEQLPPPQPLPQGNEAKRWITTLDQLDWRAARDEAWLASQSKERIRSLFRGALQALQSDDAGETEWIAAIGILGRKFGPFSLSVLRQCELEDSLTAAQRTQQLADKISPRYSETVQQAAVQAVFATGATHGGDLLAETYPSLTPGLRAQIVDLLLSQTEGQRSLLRAFDSGVISVSNLDAGRRDKLLQSTDATIRAAAEKAFEASLTAGTHASIESIRSVLELEGSVDAGREVFRKHCAACHRMEAFGHEVGPDLQALTNRDPEWLLTAILDPNRDVDARYLAWSALAMDGRVFSGMIVEETANGIRLRESEGREHWIARSDIDDFRSQKSLMPEGLQRDLSPQDLRNVITYVSAMLSPPTSLAGKPKSFPGNTPQTVKADDDGFVKLTAIVAEIRGDAIQFEATFSNIGYWHQQSDTATWKFHLTRGGAYDVYLDAACDPGSAGNEFRIDGLSTTIQGNVVSTGGWDRYQPFKVGTIELTPGAHQVTVRAASPIRHALFDLRELRLVPSGQDSGLVSSDATQSPLPRYPNEIAPFLLDESQSTERRQQVIDQRPGMGPAIIGLLTRDLATAEESESYRRIPWIWRVSLAVAMRNDGGEIRDLLEIAVPQSDQPLQHWQAVVIGGGLINGLSQQGHWPDQRLDEILKGLPDVASHWNATLHKAKLMADDQQVREGTRYDALRMIALLPEDESLPHLARYLTDGTSRELQMGAVSALVDLDSERSTEALIDALNHLTGRNRQLALEGLQRDERRQQRIRERIEAGTIQLSDQERASFR